MVVASLITLRQREAALLQTARDEARAHALTLQIALEEDYRVGRSLDAQRLINRLRENTGILSVVLFDGKGEIIAISNTLAPEEFKDSNEARQVMATGKSIEIARNKLGKDHVSIILPLQVQDQRIGAIEIVQQISFVNADIARARTHIAITVALLLVTILLVVTAVTKYSLAKPIQELLNGAAAVGSGDLKYRVPVKSAYGELARLAQEFNRTADSLAEQREALVREAEEKLELERKLRHNEQLALVGRLSAGVAHEIGAPLQVIDGRAKQLLHNTDASIEARQRNLTIVCRQTERIARMVRQLLNLSRPYNIQATKVPLLPLIQETVEMIETMADSAKVTIEIPDVSDAVIEADPESIQQVFLNICRNGIQAIPNGGRLIIQCHTDAARKNGRSFAAVRIEDTGVGIEPEHLPILFDLFFTTKEVGQGTGLGLPVSRHIIEEHGGWIEVENRANGGAVFTVYLPQPSTTDSHETAERSPT